ncbi:siderophore synthetase [Staphylococcus schweitzeri]|uniref:Siderophore synthetase n=1 Tax=Staphylococcus schweitzeri TaxID=1654388 RepID=A0A2K4AJK7_9STAP|nr:IucA/IucC family protein [Staphylococcus schweitzeri]MBE2129694.1 siderophore synthetase [Staphylococcus schweitzeri]PNZ50295.1 siderophore synthetase [Staphylococcus schweitzeri]CDR55062.1 Siderophore biosynthesis protein [Staphylococcus schweitzeri]CDR62007.1 Siderophore biosynthesis protein [Staphylococcus schweitzeri]VEE66628.1 Aerobactin synthase IucA [Staphylococcus schweitzeri]
MVYLEWTKADRNIQYRVINAIIKERIYPEQTFVRYKDKESLIEIQYHMHMLTIEVERKSALERYEFKGDITYLNKGEKSLIITLEGLLDVLNNDFEIPITEQLRNELIHSRDSLVETYKQMSHRQTLISQSFKFSRLPENINFFAWLQHIKDSGMTDDLTYSESLVPEGHPTHPLTKTKLPLTMEDVRAYAPEFEKEIPLKIMMIEKDYVVCTSMNGDDQFIIDEVIPEYHNQIRVFLKSLGLKSEDYRAILVHPWQYDHTIGQYFEQWIANKILIPTPFTVASKATLSFRTMSLIDKPYHVKLPVNVQATSAVRTVSTVTTVDGPKLSYALQGLLNQYPELKVAMEPFGEYANIDKDIARQLACIIRQKPEIDGHGATIVSACLVNKNPIDQKVIVDSYLEWLNQSINKESITTFIDRYAEALITPLIAFIQEYGIAIEAHMQNTLVNLGPHFDIRFLVRDLGGSRIDITTLQHRVSDIKITNDSLIADSIDTVIAKFQHAVIQNQMAELIHHFNQYECVDEASLFKIVQEKVAHAIDPARPHAKVLREILFGPKITVKALLNMRMENKVRQYLNIELDNPIKKEV